MQTREDARAERELVTGMGHAALTALTAIAGCALLIGLGAAVSMCWAIHPLLTLALLVGVGWLLTRLAGFAFRNSARP